MREILFRGKRDDNGKWVCGSLINLDSESGYTYICPEYSCASSLTPFELIEISSERVIPETVGQYTGLNDKNGTKIFEGDIVKCKHTIRFEPEEMERNPRRSYDGHYVKRADSTYYYDFIYYRNYEIRFVPETCDYVMKNGADRHKLNDNYTKYHELEVLGSIYDNPELLKEGVKK